MTILRHSRLPIAAATALVLLVGTVGSAFAGSPDQHLGAAIGHTSVLTVEAGSVMLVPAPGVAKDAWNPTADANLLGVDLVDPPIGHTNGDGWPFTNPAILGNSYSQTVTPTGGQASQIQVGFNSSDPYTVPETQVIFNGTSYAKWWGQSPFNATNVYLTDTFHADGLTFWASLPPGMQSQGSDATWSASVSNNWAIVHGFSNIKANGLLWNIRETSQASFQFGGLFFTIQTDDSALV